MFHTNSLRGISRLRHCSFIHLKAGLDFNEFTRSIPGALLMNDGICVTVNYHVDIVSAASFSRAFRGFCGEPEMIN